jgi:hypothetical protein
LAQILHLSTARNPFGLSAMFAIEECDPVLLRPETIPQLESAILERHRGRLRELSLHVEDGQLVLHGRATSYYGKQLAQEEVKRLTDVGIRANCIVVDQYPGPVSWASS